MDPFSFLLKELNLRLTIHPVSFLSHFMTWFQGLFYHWCEPITVVTQWSCSGPGSDLNWQCTVGTASHSEPCATAPHLSKPTIFSITIARLSEPITWDAGVRSVKHGSGWGVVYFSSMLVYVDLHLFGWVFKVPGPAGLERACRSCVGSILTPVLCLAPSHQQKSLRKVSLGLKLLYLIPKSILYNYLVCSTAIT